MNPRNILFALSFAGFIVIADNWVVSPILPAIAQDMGVSIAGTSLLIAAYMIPFGLFQLVFGYLSDRFGKRQVMSLAMVFFTIGTALCSMAAGLTDLAIYRFLTGVFAGSVMPISMALIGDVFPLEHRQSAIGTFLGITNMGQGLSLIIGGSIAYFFHWRGVFAIYALFSIVVTVMLLTVGRKIPSVGNPDSKVFSLYRQLLKNHQSRKIYSLVLLEGLFLVGPFSFMGGYIKAAYDYNNLLIGMVMTAYAIAAMITGRFSGKIAAKTGKKNTIILGLSCGLAADFLFILFGNKLIALIIGIALLGSAFTLAHSTFLTLISEFAAKSRGVAMSLAAFCFMGGGGLGILMGSNILRVSDFLTMFTVYGFGVLALIITVKFVKKVPFSSRKTLNTRH
ncbi:MFS transporter [Desulfosporosinus sp. Tol-M]|nr:MFS transporter [Desulfosporosinus sp. Tol-M]